MGDFINYLLRNSVGNKIAHSLSFTLKRIRIICMAFEEICVGFHNESTFHTFLLMTHIIALIWDVTLHWISLKSSAHFWDQRFMATWCKSDTKCGPLCFTIQCVYHSIWYYEIESVWQKESGDSSHLESRLTPADDSDHVYNCVFTFGNFGKRRFVYFVLNRSHERCIYTCFVVYRFFFLSFHFISSQCIAIVYTAAANNQR